MRRAKVIVRVRRKRAFLRVLVGLSAVGALILVIVWRLHPLVVSLMHSF